MPKLVAQTAVEKYIIKDSGGLLSKDDPIHVKFVQATEGDSNRRSQMLQSRVRREWGGDDDEVIYAESSEAITPSKQRCVEAYLTMRSCNVLVESDTRKGKYGLLFPHKDGEISVRDFDHFASLWNRLTPEWARLIHTVCIMVNPDWGNALYDREAFVDSLADTEGEGDGVEESPE